MKTARPQRLISIRADEIRNIFFNLKISPDLPVTELPLIAIFSNI
jgi:hypothetical protein